MAETGLHTAELPLTVKVTMCLILVTGMIYVGGDVRHFWDRLKKPPTPLSACFFLSDWLARMERMPRATSEATVRVAESLSQSG